MGVPLPGPMSRGGLKLVFKGDGLIQAGSFLSVAWMFPIRWHCEAFDTSSRPLIIIRISLPGPGRALTNGGNWY
jgi:hypothetical protein